MPAMLPRWLGLFVGVLLATGCASDVSPPRGPLAVTHRVLTGTARQDDRGMHLGCEIGGAMRAGIGCVMRSTLGYDTGVPSAASLTRPNIMPPAFLNRTIAIERSWRPAGERSWRVLPAVYVRPSRDIVGVRFDLPADRPPKVDLRSVAYLLEVPPTHRKSAPVRVGPGAVLRGGFALAGLGPLSHPSVTRFRVAVRDRGRVTVLLDRVVEPDTSAAREWTDFKLPLDRFTGRPVRFLFSARGTPGPGTSKLYLDRATIPVWSEAVVQEPRDEPLARNVVLISLDTLRADHLGVYGSTLPVSPRIDRLADEGTLFDRAVSTYPSTTAAHASMLSGVYPSVHGAWDVLEPISHDVPMLAEQLAAAGYTTVGITEDGMLSHLGGFRRGFAHYREFRGQSGSVDTPGFLVEGVDAALEWIAQHRDERFFLFLHSYAVHGPFTPPPAYDVFKTWHDADGVERPIDDDTPPGVRDEHKYNGEILFADHEIGRFLDQLRTLVEPAQTIVVLASDHGESFDLRHGAAGHGLTLAEEVLHVPLMIVAPGRVPAGRRVAPPVSLIDVSPTILDLVGRPIPAEMQGRSLVPMLTDPIPADLADRPLFSEMHFKEERQMAVHRGALKWIVGTTSFSGEQFYDLGTDPDETHTLESAGDGARGAELVADFRRDVARRVAGRDATGQKAVPDADTAEKLRMLGYMD